MLTSQELRLLILICEAQLSAELPPPVALGVLCLARRLVELFSETLQREASQREAQVQSESVGN